MLVTMMTATAVAGMPNLDGRRLHAGTSCFTIERDGKALGETLQSVRRKRFEGRDIWDIVVHQRVGTMFDMRDHFILDHASMAPIAFDSRRGSKIGERGWHRISLRYSPSRILGSKTDAKRTTVIDVPLDRKVVEGNLWGLTFAALPLRGGASFTVPNWQYDKGFGAFTVRVVGSETQATPTGAVPAWVVEAGTDPAQMTRYLIAKVRPTELGYRAGPMVQKLGGSCAGLG